VNQLAGSIFGQEVAHFPDHGFGGLGGLRTRLRGGCGAANRRGKLRICGRRIGGQFASRSIPQRFLLKLLLKHPIQLYSMQIGSNRNEDAICLPNGSGNKGIFRKRNGLLRQC
jgi:hypothetical protein